ncbi:MAG: AAA family ATPase [Bacillota bacterium]
MLNERDLILRGNKIPAGVLCSSLKSGRISNAYLFKGPKGAPKEALALEFARGLLCEGDEPHLRGEACGKCWSCRAASNHAHPDLIEVEKEGSTIKIRKSHEMLKEAMARPYRSARKVFIIKDAEDMTVEASNALLKVLEEPPSYVTFILTAMNVRAIPETIISRCQTVPFRKLPGDGDGGTGEQPLAEILQGSPVELAQKYAKAESSRRVDVLIDLEIELVKRLRSRSALQGEGDAAGRQAEREPGRLYRAVRSLQKAKERLYGNTNPFLTLSVLFMDLARTCQEGE